MQIEGIKTGTLNPKNMLTKVIILIVDRLSKEVAQQFDQAQGLLADVADHYDFENMAVAMFNNRTAYIIIICIKWLEILKKDLEYTADACQMPCNSSLTTMIDQILTYQKTLAFGILESIMPARITDFKKEFETILQLAKQISYDQKPDEAHMQTLLEAVSKFKHYNPKTAVEKWLEIFYTDNRPESCLEPAITLDIEEKEMFVAIAQELVGRTMEKHLNDFQQNHRSLKNYLSILAQKEIHHGNKTLINCLEKCLQLLSPPNDGKSSEAVSSPEIQSKTTTSAVEPIMQFVKRFLKM